MFWWLNSYGTDLMQRHTRKYINACEWQRLLVQVETLVSASNSIHDYTV